MIVVQWKRQSGSKVLECGLLRMVDWRWWKMNPFSDKKPLGITRKNVAALRLLHPTVSSILLELF